ncbi:MAG: AMP-binding protein [Bacteroidota bacterium]
MATLLQVLAGDDAAPAFRVTEDGPAFTRAGLRADITHVATMLARAGVQRGDVVSLCYRNQIENAISFLAVTWLGATAAPLNASYAKAEFEYDMRNVGTKFLLVAAEGHELVESVAAELGIAVLSVETAKDGSTVVAKSKCAIADKDPDPMPAPQPDDTALFLHTSGTTGKPKGVPLSHTNMLTTLANITATYELTGADKSYLVMPLFHVHGLMAALFSTLYSGGEVILPARSQGFRVEIFWKEVAEYGATWYTAVPTMHQLLLKGLDTYAAAGKPQVRFIRSCSASLPPSVLLELEAQFNAPVLEAYAMTEAAHQMASNPLPKHGPHKPGSVGRGTNVEIVIFPADSETALPANEVAEVCIRGPNVTKGYHNRPDANAESFTPSGYFRTGDLGYLDDDGFLFLTGRKKEQVNRGGEKIAPVAIDNVLLRCPGVSSLFAFGVPHEDLGETMAVIVVLDAGAKVSLAQLNRFGLDSGELGLQWLPEVIVYSDKVPKGPTGKVQRVKLSSMLGMPKLTTADAGSAFTYTQGKLERVVEEESASGAGQAADLPTVEAAVGVILGLDVSGMGDKELLLDSFTATRLATLLNKRFPCDVKPKNLLKGVTIPSILEQVLTTESAAPRAYESLDLPTVEAAVGSILGLDVSGMGDKELLIDSFTATRLATLLNERFPCGVQPKSLLKGVTLPRIHELVLTTESAAPTTIDFEKEAEVPESLAAGITAAVKAGPMTAEDAVLLTGATGFLGAHMLGVLLRTTSYPVVCVVRASDDEKAAQRVEAALRKQEVWNDSFAARVRCFAGDMLSPNFGLDDAKVASLSNVRLLIQNAAAVNHATLFPDLKDSNVGSLVRAIALAHTIEASGAAVHVAYVSTGGVCGRIENPDAPSPPRIPLEKVGGANGYVQTKWVSERMVENANELAFKAGAPARYSIFRPGAITGHSETGACNLGDSINRYVIGFTLLGCAPPLPPDVHVDMSPVDWQAEAHVGLALQDVGLGGGVEGATPCYTLDNGNSLTYGELVKVLDLPVAETYADWLAKLQAALDAEDENTPHRNPLGDLLGALKAGAPKFGSTGSAAHMKMLADRGYPSPPISKAIVDVYLKRFALEKALPLP